MSAQVEVDLGPKYTAIITATRALNAAESLMRLGASSTDALAGVRMEEALHDLARALGKRVVPKIAERACLACGRPVPV